METGENTGGKKKSKTLRTFLTVVAYVVAFTVAFIVCFAIGAFISLQTTGFFEDTTESGEGTVGDTEGTAQFSVYLLQYSTYTQMFQYGLTPTTSPQTLSDVPWKDTYVTISDLGNFAASNLASKQGNSSTILLFQAIANGRAGQYQLQELTVNGQAASRNTYLYDGDKIVAIVTFD